MIFRIVAALALGLVIALAALPLWFPWIAWPVAKSLGITYADYQRDGYARFHVSNLVVRAKTGVFEAKRAGAFVPTAWLWRMAFGTNAAPFLTASDWEFSFQQKSNTPASSSSAFTNTTKLNDTFKTLKRWMPKAEFTNGAIRANGIQIAIPNAVWQKGALAAKLVLPQNRPFTLNADWLANAPLKISLASAPLNFQTELSLAKTNNAAVQLSANGVWSSNRFALAAIFPRNGWIPEFATARADSFQIPASLVKLGDYEKIAGSFDGDWNGARFTMNLTARAIPKSAALPEWNIEARASGDTNSATIDSAKITAPWLNAKLSEGARVRFKPPFLIQPARLDVSADLARQSWIDASGILRGTALFRPGTNEYPHIGFVLIGSGVTVSNFQSRTLQLNGEFNWPRIKLASTRIVMTNGSEAILSGVFNVPKKNIERGEVNFSGALGSKILPAGYSFQHAKLDAQFSGPLSAISHSGKLNAENVVIPNGKPMNVSASWDGLGLDLRQAAVSLSTSNAMLGFHGALNTSSNGAEVSIFEMSLQSSNQPEMKLERPFQIAFQKTETNKVGSDWKLQIQPAHWSGGGRDLDLQADVNWPGSGNFRIAARGLTTDLLKQFLKLPDANATLQNLALTGGWTNGPISFSLDSLAEIRTKPHYTFSAKANLTGGGTGISIRQLSISSATQMVCHAEGKLPFIFQPVARGDMLRIDADRPLALRAFTETNSLLWSQLAEISGVRLSDPLLSANVSGTWAEPQGGIAMSATSIEFPGEVRRLPKIEDLALNVKLNRDEIVLSRFQAFAENQMVRATANMPLGEGFWTALLHGRRKFDWRELNAEIEMSNAQIAPFTVFVPDILAPQGEFSVKLGLKRGGKLSGEMNFENVTTRPLATLGPMRNIHATALLANDKITLTNAAANIGGQPIRLNGNVQLGENFWKNKSLPPFQLYVRGTNVPLVRQANVLVRADLNVAITNSVATNAIVAGTVKLRDSFFLSNLKDLAPGKVAAPERRPPYFSIEAEPFANWRLALQVSGEKFLKVQTPLFRGVVSTTMQLEGTLKEPLALGEARINSGNVTFPFGSLSVQQGFVSLTSANPYHPQLFVSATAQRLGYDIKMEATGPADQPIVQFSASPPLSSEDIVLMLTTGRSPQGIASAGTRQRAQGIAVFVGKNLLSEFGIGGGGEDRLTVRSGEQVTEAGKPTYEVEYKLTEDWSLVGEYDRFGDYNAGLKWRVYSK